MDNEREFNRRLGAVLKNYRKIRGFTQQEVADKLGVSKMAVSNWESGNRSIYAVTFSDYCNVIGVTMGEVVSKL